LVGLPTSRRKRRESLRELRSEPQKASPRRAIHCVSARPAPPYPAAGNPGPCAIFPLPTKGKLPGSHRALHGEGTRKNASLGANARGHPFRLGATFRVSACEPNGSAEASRRRTRSASQQRRKHGRRTRSAFSQRRGAACGGGRGFGRRGDVRSEARARAWPPRRGLAARGPPHWGRGQGVAPVPGRAEQRCRGAASTRAGATPRV